MEKYYYNYLNSKEEKDEEISNEEKDEKMLDEEMSDEEIIIKDKKTKKNELPIFESDDENDSF